MARRSSNRGFATRSYGTTTVLGSVNSAPASVSLGFQPLTAPMYTPGAANADRWYTTGISVSRAPATTVAGTARPSCAIADRRHAARPAACGAAMLVPPLISSPVFQRGTDENATPGATRSGFATSAPRELHHPITSGAGAVPGCTGRAKAPG